ncbi:MAG TPA: TMEM175 family protein [Solirubrobacterales bacterium]|nr:TMEM175 family protein [Solirubrobacterales bacterium]
MARARKPRKREEHEVEFGRIVAFSDGVFSIAITLLVLGITIDKDIPRDELAHALWEQHEALLAYAISFAVIARFWLVHHSFFSEVRAFDSRLIALNMLYLGFLVLIPFSSQVLGDYGGQLPAVIVYSANLAIVVLIGQWMSWDARRAGLVVVDARTSRENLLRSLFIALVFLASIVVALFDASIAPFVWFLLFFEGRAHVIQRLSRRGAG